MKKELGGKRLGGGRKMKVDLNTYGRTTFNTSTKTVTSMSSGTVVPVWVKLGLPGAKLKVQLGTKIITQPTISTLMGSYDVEIHCFEGPLRLWQAELMMDKVDIGLNIADIKLPQMTLRAAKTGDINTQIHPSSIFNYMNIAGLGNPIDGGTLIERNFFATPWLMYWEVIKNYFANKQEEEAAVIHTPVPTITDTVTTIQLLVDGSGVFFVPGQNETPTPYPLIPASIQMKVAYDTTPPEIGYIELLFENIGWVKAESAFAIRQEGGGGGEIYYSLVTGMFWNANILQWRYANANGIPPETKPQITKFPLKNIDTMRKRIMAHEDEGTPFVIDNTIDLAPYNLALAQNSGSGNTSASKNQEGLALTTYKSDLFNNWLRTEFIEGINEASRVNTDTGSFTIDAINTAKKMQNYLNRVAVAGGSFSDFIEVTYGIDMITRPISPIYHGSLLKELGFEEIVSSAATDVGGTKQPLGQLAGKGVMGNKHKGGQFEINVKEYSVIMAVAVIRPRIIYSQGNHWMMNLTNLEEIHKPEFDKIGFQDLITDQMDYRSTDIFDDIKQFKTIGKQTAWINYQTDIPRAKGNFALENNSMAQVLNRRYEWDPEAGDAGETIDFTAYIDPSKFNYVFADTRLDAQNFNVQVSIDVEERLVMSGNQMPTL